jgi:hypothetical protein
MRMAVQAGGLSVSRPPSVSNTGMGSERNIRVGLQLLDQLLQLCNFADLFERKDFVLLVAIDSHARGIITTVFEPMKTCRHVSDAVSSCSHWECQGLTVDESVQYVFAVLLN